MERLISQIDLLRVGRWNPRECPVVGRVCFGVRHFLAGTTIRSTLLPRVWPGGGRGGRRRSCSDGTYGMYLTFAQRHRLSPSRLVHWTGQANSRARLFSSC